MLVVGVLVVGACSGDDDSDDVDTSGATTTPPAAGPTTADAPAAAAAADLCASAEPSGAGPAVQNPDLVEISGLAASVTHDGALWAHNDSGGLPEVFAIGEDGAHLGRFQLDDAAAFDWEDMAIANETLFLGDIGDNFKIRPAITVYRVAEPAIGADAATTSQVLEDVDELEVSYADGQRDAETLLADPISGDVFVVSKFESPVGLYRIPADTPTGATYTMERVADITLPAEETATGGEISADGTLIAIRTYHDVLLWQRAPDQTVAEAMAAEPCVAPQADETQGEAIAISASGQGYVTISEGVNQPVNAFALP